VLEKFEKLASLRVLKFEVLKESCLLKEEFVHGDLLEHK
jgi:hypothetical protein